MVWHFRAGLCGSLGYKSNKARSSNGVKPQRSRLERCIFWLSILLRSRGPGLPQPERRWIWGSYGRFVQPILNLYLAQLDSGQETTPPQFTRGIDAWRHCPPLNPLKEYDILGKSVGFPDHERHSHARTCRVPGARAGNSQVCHSDPQHLRGLRLQAQGPYAPVIARGSFQGQ